MAQVAVPAVGKGWFVGKRRRTLHYKVGSGQLCESNAKSRQRVQARGFAQEDALTFASLKDEIDFLDRAVQVLRALPSFYTDLTEREGERLFLVIADAMFDVLSDPRLNAETRVELVNALGAAIEFAASQGLYGHAVLASWDLAIGAIPGGSPTADIREAVVAELDRLGRCPHESARLSAEQGMNRLRS